MVPFNFRMHSTSSHDAHKHHRSQTLPIIRGKNALSNPKLLQMIDSNTASKYKNIYFPLEFYGVWIRLYTIKSVFMSASETQPEEKSLNINRATDCLFFRRLRNLSLYLVKVHLETK